MTDIQKCILKIFKEIADLCNKHDIPYFAIGGTCLGAVRHKGFIPWDDDMDIAIPIENYEKFIVLAKKGLPEHLSLYIPSEMSHNPYTFIKVMDNRTTMTENCEAYWPDCYEGVWVDVMPISGLPDNKRGINRFMRNAKIIRWITYRVKASYQDHQGIVDKVGWILCRPLYYLLPRSFFWNQWLRFITKFPLLTSRYTGYVWSRNLYRLVFPTQWFSDYVLLDFEDTKIRCPVGWHDFLSQMFGDYMQYPPEDKRNSGHGFDKGIIDLEHSYRDYQSGKLKISERRK